MNVFDLAAKITLDTKGYETGLSKASGLASSAASKIGGGLKTAAKIGAGALTAATGAVAAMAGSSVKTGMQFDKSMSQVAATMGTTVDKIQNLRDFAQKMGSTTKFTASESAEALNYMALAGYDAQMSMKMLPNVLNLAAAGDMELATASDMVTDAQSALGLSAKKTTKMVNQMAKTSSKTNTSVSQLGSAILAIGGTARSLKGGTKELNASLGILADNGIKGAEGGIKLRNIMMSLTPKSSDAAEAMEALGMKAYDADGKMRSLDEIFGDLNKSLGKMTDEQRTNKLAMIFNKQDLKAVNALLNTNKDRWDEVYKSIDGAQGAAEKMAKTQLDNLSGDVTIFKSALDGAKLAISDGLTPNLREFVQFGTKGITKLTKVFQKSGLNAAMQEFGTFISEGITKLVEKVPDMVKQGAGLLEGIANGIVKNKKSIGNALSKVVSAIADVLPNMVGSIVDLITALIDELAKNSGKIIDKIIGAIKKLIDKLLETGKDGKSRIEKIINSIFDLVVNSVTALANKLPELTPKIVNLITELLKSIFKNANKITSGLSTIISDIIESITNGISQLISDAPELLSDLVTALAKSLPELLKAGIQGTIALFTSVVQLIPELLKLPVTLTTSLLSGLSDAWADQNLSGDAKKNFKKYLKGIFGTGTDEVASETEEHAKEQFGGTFGKMSANITEGSLALGTEAYKGTYAIGGRLTSGFIDGQPKSFSEGWATPMYTQVKTAINNVAYIVYLGTTQIWEKIIAFFNEHSLKDVGQNLGLQLADGIIEGLKAGLANIASGGLAGLLQSITAPTVPQTTTNNSRAVNVKIEINNPSVRSNNDIQSIAEAVNNSLGSLFRQREVAYG